jgi:S-formylglutathione hydrolase FrmB
MCGVNVQTGNGRTGSGAFSMLEGWLPITVQLVALLLLVTAIGWRTRRFRLRWLPVCVAVALLGAGGTYVAFGQSGLASDPAPLRLWVWLGLTLGALALVVVGWRDARWWRRALAVLAVPLCALSTGVVLNQWLGYFVSVQRAWEHITAAPLPNQVDAATLPTLRGTVPDAGRIVQVTIPATASGFRHRDEYVYLPPAWFAGPTPPALPAVMMIGGEFTTSADWVRNANADKVVNAYAAAHGGTAPILVFVDPAGTFNTDTECVDGPRGNAESHLTKDVVPYVVQQFGASADPRQWAVAGWSMGGTCALDLAAMHPELFGTFYDISGDSSPYAGDKQQTIDRLYGGDAAVWAHYDPATVLTGHTPYLDSAGLIEAPDGSGQFAGDPPSAAELHSMAWQIGKDRHLCALATAVHMSCQVQTTPGQHDWTTGATTFANGFGWIADRLLTPGPPAVPPSPAPAPTG